MSARGITIVSASAGSGKTYRLTHEVTTAVDPKGANSVPLEGLVAVTFTRKAHAELAARIRHKLVETGAYEEALRLPLAYLGTVHAACLRWLQEFALDAGLSPNVDVVADDQAKLLRQALETGLDSAARARMNRLAWNVELRLASQTHRVDWQTPVFNIMELARSNRIAPDALAAMAERSIAGLLALLPPPVSNGDALDEALKREIAKAADELAKKNDRKANTEKALALLETSRRRLDDGELAWSDWAKLSTIAPSKLCESIVKELKDTAAQYGTHPRLHQELRELTLAIFDAAKIGLSAYQAWKTKRRVVDYVDMLDRALDLVDQARVGGELEERLRLVVVDEFQDTSPIQLALFVRLHQLAGRSLWVGDRKQCIFEYAGADPLLMDAVSGWVAKSEGVRETLADNYRSRPELVHACSELFVSALAPHGFTREEISVNPKRSVRSELDVLPPFGAWCLETANAAQDAEAIAEGIRRMLAAPSGTPVVDRITNEVRPVRPADIAILVATNDAARAVAGALHARGIRPAIARAGLLATPEGALTDAALRWLIDEGDTLASATIDALTGFDGGDANAWLTARIAGTASSANGWRTALTPLRDALGVLSPSEAVDAVHAALDAVHLCARWPDAPQRIANLDALRALASRYEARCAQDREGATVAGLLRCFDDVREKRLDRGEMIASDDQHVPTDDGAVVVCTYHKAKGLEWPVVVLATLDKHERRDAFEVTPESDTDGFDPERPLDGRWIRYWPWPFGPLEKVPLAEDAARSPEGRRVAQREAKERARLLYVGFTRARDHLVLAVRVQKDKRKSAWLDALADPQGAPLVELPISDADGNVGQTRIGGTLAVATRVARLGHVRPERDDEGADVSWFARAASSALVRPPYRIVPSATQEALASVSIRAVERLSSPLVLESKGYDYAVLGDAVHAFLAADVEGLAAEERLERARRLVSGAGLQGVVRPEWLLRAGDELRAWVEKKWPGAIWRREVWVDAFVATEEGERRLRGSIDLLLETDAGFVVVDHKTFPATNEAAWRVKCVEYAPQLAAYADVLARAEGKPVLGQWIHLPIGGALVEVCGQ